MKLFTESPTALLTLWWHKECIFAFYSAVYTADHKHPLQYVVTKGLIDASVALTQHLFWTLLRVSAIAWGATEIIFVLKAYKY